MATAKEMARKILKKAELATAELKAAEMRLLAAATEESVENDVHERRKNLLNLEEFIRSLAQSLAHMLKEWEVSEAKCGKLEEQLRTVHEKDLLKRFCEDDKHLAEKLVRKMEVMRRDMDVLKAENKANASKISALEEMCDFMKEIRSLLENKLDELKEEKMELIDNWSQSENKLEELKKEKLELVANRSQMENKLEELKEEKLELVANRSQLENKLEELMEEKQELIANRCQLENKLEELKKEKMELLEVIGMLGRKMRKLRMILREIRQSYPDTGTSANPPPDPAQEEVRLRPKRIHKDPAWIQDYYTGMKDRASR